MTALQNPSVQPVAVPDRGVALTAFMDSLHRYNPWENPPVIVPEKPPPAPEIKEVAVETKLDLNLIGAMILPEHSWAILTRKKDPNAQLVLQVGDDVEGATLKKIERDAVYFDNHGRMERLVMQDAFKPEGVVVAPPPPPPAPNNKSIARNEYEDMLAKGMDMLTGVNITPFYQGKDAVGYRVKFPDDKKEFLKFGLASDDVIQQVNGIPVTDTARITQLANQLKTQTAVRLDVLRNNSPQTIEITIGK